MENSATSTPPVPSTSDRILDAAEDIFAEKGYSATSLGDVADRVGIRSPSLYNHFKFNFWAFVSQFETFRFTFPVRISCSWFEHYFILF